MIDVASPRLDAAPAAASARHTYARVTRDKGLIVTCLAVGLVATLIVDIGLGPARLGPWDVVEAILFPGAVDVARSAIVWDIRLPIALMAVVVGASLAIAGAEMQTILNNPLASPFTLGVSAAAGFGAALAIVLGISVVPVFGPFLIAGNAFIFALAASMLIYAFSMLRGATSETMVLLGIALVFLFGALLALLEYIASEQALQQVVFWSLGSLAKASWLKLAICTAVLVGCIPVFAVSAWQLTTLRLGDDAARALGLNVERLRLNVLIAVSVLAAASVAFVGTIGFVGLVGPHVARMLVGEDQRYFLPASALAGAILLSVTSIVSKSIVPGVIVPVGIITSLVGVPFFLSLILTRRRHFWA